MVGKRSAAGAGSKMGWVSVLLEKRWRRLESRVVVEKARDAIGNAEWQLQNNRWIVLLRSRMGISRNNQSLRPQNC